MQSRSRWATWRRSHMSSVSAVRENWSAACRISALAPHVSRSMRLAADSREALRYLYWGVPISIAGSARPMSAEAASRGPVRATGGARDWPRSRDQLISCSERSRRRATQPGIWIRTPSRQRSGIRRSTNPVERVSSNSNVESSYASETSLLMCCKGYAESGIRIRAWTHLVHLVRMIDCRPMV